MKGLHVFFTRPDSGDEIFEGYRGYWTAPAAAAEDDLALIYVSEQRALVALARLTSPPFRDEADEFGWGQGAWWARVRILRLLPHPIPLASVKHVARIHDWKAWDVLRGRRHVIVPTQHHRWLRNFVSTHDSVAGRMLGAESNGQPELPDAGTDTPRRGSWKTSRVIRDTRVGKVLKERYDGACQVCGARLTVAPGQFYSEAHHLRPIGKPHNGPDRTSNVLVLCPTHHAEFDLALIGIDPRTLRLRTVNPRHTHRRRAVRLEPFHRLDTHHLRYHMRRFKRVLAQFPTSRRAKP